MSHLDSLIKMQRLTGGYGYRPSTNHPALVKIAIECWRAIHPLPTITPPRSRPTREPSASSEEVPLSAKRTRSRPAATGDLNTQFFEMIQGDHELYNRILHYEVRFLHMGCGCVLMRELSRSASTSSSASLSQQVSPRRDGSRDSSASLISRYGCFCWMRTKLIDVGDHVLHRGPDGAAAASLTG
jgi:hypothetical protein